MYDYLLVYVYDENGRYTQPVEVKNNAEAVAKAILFYGMAGNRIVVTDLMDELTFDALGIFMNTWRGTGAKFSHSDYIQAYHKWYDKCGSITEKSFLYKRKKAK